MSEREPRTNTPDLAMQAYCINCLREQYGPAVWDISHGKHPCVWCGHTPEQMTQAAWLAALKAKREEQSNA